MKTNMFGKGELANDTIDNARQVLEPREYRTLCSRYLKALNAKHSKLVGIDTAKYELIAKDGKFISQNVATFKDSDQLYG